MTLDPPPNFDRRDHDEGDTTPNLGLLRLACSLAILAGGFLMVGLAVFLLVPLTTKLEWISDRPCNMFDRKSRQLDRGSKGSMREYARARGECERPESGIRMGLFLVDKENPFNYRLLDGQRFGFRSGFKHSPIQSIASGVQRPPRATQSRLT